MDPVWNPNPDNYVFPILVSGSSIYVGGLFTNIGGQARNCIAKLDNVTGSADASWNVSLNSFCNTLTKSGNDLYIGGSFTKMDNNVQPYIALFSDGLLPVELVHFSLTRQNNCVELNWTTITEVNNYGFEIERTPLIPPFGKGGRPEEGGWEKIGFVAGSGNSNSKKEYSFTDDLHHTSIQSYNHTFRYRLKQIDNDGTFSYSNIIEAEVTDIPAEFMLYQNYPNPFNPSTVISYQLPVNTFVTLKVFDIIGNEVATLVNQEKPAGSYEVTFDASNLTSGVYFYELRTDNFRSVRKLMLIK